MSQKPELKSLKKEEGEQPLQEVQVKEKMRLERWIWQDGTVDVRGRTIHQSAPGQRH